MKPYTLHVETCRQTCASTSVRECADANQHGTVRTRDTFQHMSQDMRDDMSLVTIGADSTGATGNFAPVLTQEPGQTLRFAPVPFMAVL